MKFSVNVAASFGQAAQRCAMDVEIVRGKIPRF